MTTRICEIDDCSTKHYGRGYCYRHWRAWKKNGDPTAIRPYRRFWTKVDVRGDDECWLWLGETDSDGYGTHGNGLTQENSNLAHRAAYARLVGPIPDGLVLDHLCRMRSCVNPAHLEVVTVAENTRRGEGFAAKNARKTHCRRGHPLSGDNLYIHPRRNVRDCKQCRNAAGRRSRKRRAKRKVLS